MAKFTGELAEFSLGGTVYRCLSNYGWSGSVADAVAQCSGSSAGETVRRPGVPDDQFTFDVVLDAGSVTEISALKRGQTGAFEFHPNGDVAGEIEFLAPNAVVLSSNLGGSPTSLNILSITVGIDGALTVQAAT